MTTIVYQLRCYQRDWSLRDAMEIHDWYLTKETAWRVGQEWLQRLGSTFWLDPTGEGWVVAPSTTQRNLPLCVGVHPFDLDDLLNFWDIADDTTKML